MEVLLQPWGIFAAIDFYATLKGLRRSRGIANAFSVLSPLQITLRCLNVEVAIHLKCFDFFRELKGLLYFGAH